MVRCCRCRRVWSSGHVLSFASGKDRRLDRRRDGGGSRCCRCRLMRQPGMRFAAGRTAAHASQFFAFSLCLNLVRSCRRRITGRSSTLSSPAIRTIPHYLSNIPRVSGPLAFVVSSREAVAAPWPPRVAVVASPRIAQPMHAADRRPASQSAYHTPLWRQFAKTTFARTNPKFDIQFGTPYLGRYTSLTTNMCALRLDGRQLLIRT